MHLCQSPVLSSVLTGMGELAVFCRALEGVSNSGAFIGIPLHQSLWCYCWTLMTDRERLVYIRNPHSLKEGTETSHHHGCCTSAVRLGHTVSAPQRKTDVQFARALLLYPRCGAGWAWRNTHGNCYWLVLLTLVSDWALERDPTTSVTLTLRLPSLLQGTRVTYVTETFQQPLHQAEMLWASCLFWNPVKILHILWRGSWPRQMLPPYENVMKRWCL